MENTQYHSQQGTSRHYVLLYGQRTETSGRVGSGTTTEKRNVYENTSDASTTTGAVSRVYSGSKLQTRTI